MHTLHSGIREHAHPQTGTGSIYTPHGWNREIACTPYTVGSGSMHTHRLGQGAFTPHMVEQGDSMHTQHCGTVSMHTHRLGQGACTSHMVEKGYSMHKPHVEQEDMYIYHVHCTQWHICTCMKRYSSSYKMRKALTETGRYPCHTTCTRPGRGR